ncbi:glycosyltransferase family 1 protein, partial [Streptomyces sp. SID11233]|nr:glycosyltransferase family 1 protein [Streptomyces sp. SID11233]
WEESGQDPLRLLAALPQDRLATLAADERYVRRLGEAAAALDTYLSDGRWYQEQDPAALPGAIAYFSPEFGVTAALPQYSGGLGILAGDHLKSASDLGV